MSYSSSLDISVRFSAPAERVWSALTDPKQLCAWWPQARIDPQKGGSVRLVTERPKKKRDRTLTGTVRHWDKRERIVIEAHSEPRGFDSRVTFLVSQLKHKSRLRVIEESKKNSSMDGVVLSEAREGWRIVLDALTTHLEE